MEFHISQNKVFERVILRQQRATPTVTIFVQLVSFYLY